jgi:site-specific DNA recombinase
LRNKADHLLTGLLFDDAGHRMVPTHATKAGVRYRYYASTSVLHGEAKTASAGSVSRIPAADVEDTVVKSLKEYLGANQGMSAESLGDRHAIAERVAGIVVGWSSVSSQTARTIHQIPHMSGRSQFPGRNPPSRRSRQILLPHNAMRSDVRPEQFARRARLVSTIARGRQWLDDVVSGRVTTVAYLGAREN